MWRTSFVAPTGSPLLKGSSLRSSKSEHTAVTDCWILDEEVDPVATKSRLITSKVMVVLLGFMVIWMGFR